MERGNLLNFVEKTLFPYFRSRLDLNLRNTTQQNDPGQRNKTEIKRRKGGKSRYEPIGYSLNKESSLGTFTLL